MFLLMAKPCSMDSVIMVSNIEDRKLGEGGQEDTRQIPLYFRR